MMEQRQSTKAIKGVSSELQFAFHYLNERGVVGFVL